jgi:hypothetical protein
LASGHYAQYLYFVWMAESKEPLPRAGLGTRPRLRMALRSSRVVYLMLLLGLGGIVTLLLTFLSSGLRAGAGWMQWRPDTALALAPWAAAMIGVNFEHYWLDHRIWRTPRPVAAATALAA